MKKLTHKVGVPKHGLTAVSGGDKANRSERQKERGAMRGSGWKVERTGRNEVCGGKDGSQGQVEAGRDAYTERGGAEDGNDVQQSPRIDGGCQA